MRFVSGRRQAGRGLRLHGDTLLAASSASVGREQVYCEHEQSQGANVTDVPHLLIPHRRQAGRSRTLVLCLNDRRSVFARISRTS